MADEKKLGEGVTTVVKIDNTVRRNANRWTGSVHKLLQHLRQTGFMAAPEAYGYDEKGREVVSYLDGDVYHYPLPMSAKSNQALISAAKLLREYHDATVDFAKIYRGEWQFEDHPPVEVICHGDYAPYNCVMRGDQIIGIIDFDTAHPGSRMWDVAYAVYRFAPLTAPENVDGFGDRDAQASRLKTFCDVYGLENKQALISNVLERLQALQDFMHASAAAGDKSYQDCLAAGHAALYKRDLMYIQSNADYFSNELKK